MRFPKGLSFLRESTISISITMALLYFIACLFAGVSYVHESISDGQNFIVFFFNSRCDICCWRYLYHSNGRSFNLS
ncbi:PTS transporter subunit IIC [Staphylococcus aureus]